MIGKREEMEELLKSTKLFLLKHEELYWAGKCDTVLRKKELSYDSALSELASWFGGMGSFSDLVLHELNGHRVADEEYRAVNDKLTALRNALWEFVGGEQKN